MIALFVLPVYILFVLCIATSGTNAWEIPSFLLDSLPQNDPTSEYVRQLQNTTQNSTANETVYNDQGFLDEPLVGDQGTAVPTESPAPSPSPSDAPTQFPTITGNPTSKPTASPTESPAPSPSPSDAPTSAPSGAPSIPPSEYPTISNPPSLMPSVAPSDNPTVHPSISPSASPTISSPPSLSPSHAPSDLPTSIPSVLPSSSPTLVAEVMADFTIQFSIETGELDDTQINALQEATVGFLSKDITLEDGKLSDVVVQFVNQLVIDASNDNKTASMEKNSTRSLFDNLSLQQKLVVDFSVIALYNGPDNLFDLHSALDPLFQDSNSRWYKWLSTADSVFAPLAPEPILPDENASIESSSNPSGSSGGVPGGTIAIVSILAVASLAIGIAASIYSIRHYRRSTYGEELTSPRGSLEGFGSYAQEENVEDRHKSHLVDVSQEKRELDNRRESHAMEGRQVSHELEGRQESHTMEGLRQRRVDHAPKTKNPLLSQSASEYDNESAQSWMKPPMSPNSLEMGKVVPIAEIMKKNPRSIDDQNKKGDAWNHIQLKKSESRIDPPTTKTDSVVDVSSKRTTDRRKFEDPRHIGSLLDTNTEISDMTRSQLPVVGGHEIKLTKSNGGTLGAKAGSEANSGFTTSDFSDHAKSFFEQGEKKSSKVDRTALVRQTTSATIPVVGPALMEAHLRSYDTVTTRGGLYDVFAPPGPIGIVVDTTKDGPAVHSLKRTSPMLGLINAGDLIVALDDVDTRGMTAATLTQLMARKATQKERKITLLTIDNL